MPSMAKLATVPCSAAVMKSSSMRTEGGDAMEEVVVTNMVRSLQSSTVRIDCNLID